MFNDPVNHPAHYTGGKYECIDFIESWGLGFHLGNAVKYIVRAGKKDPEKKEEDLKKALWYLKRAAQDKPLTLMSMTNHDQQISSLMFCADKDIMDFQDVIAQIVYGRPALAADILEEVMHK